MRHAAPSPSLGVLAVLTFLSLAGCGPTEEERACAGVICTAGACQAELGQPVCRCAAQGATAGLPCEIAEPLAPSASISVGAFEPRPGGERASGFFAVEFQPGHIYRFTCATSDFYDSGCGVRLWNDAGELLHEVSGSSRNTVYINASVEGRYFLEAYPTGAQTQGDYGYQWEDLGKDDFADEPRHAGTRKPSNEPFTGRVEQPNDRDVIAINAVKGHTYRFECEAEMRRRWGVYFHDAGGQPRGTFEETSTRQQAVQWEASYTGFLYAALWTDSATSHEMDTYTCWLKDLGFDDHGDTEQTATPITVGDPGVQGHFEQPGDVDVFSFKAPASHVFRFICEAEPSDAACTPVLFYISTVGPRSSGTPFPGWQGGTYALSVKSSCEGPSAPRAAYTCRMEDLGPDDHSAYPTDSPTPLPLGEPVSVQSQWSLDEDTLAFPATAGHRYRLSVTPAPLSLDYTVQLISPSRTLQRVVEATPGAARYTLTTGVSEQVYVIVGGSSPEGPPIEYQLLLEDLGAP